MNMICAEGGRGLVSPCSESGGEGTYQHHEEKTLARSEHTVDESDGQRLVHGDLVVVDRLEPREARLQHADIYQSPFC